MTEFHSNGVIGFVECGTCWKFTKKKNLGVLSKFQMLVYDFNFAFLLEKSTAGCQNISKSEMKTGLFG